MILAYTSSAVSEIYHCKDGGGRTVFKDAPCDEGETYIEELNIQVDGEKQAKGVVAAPDDRSGKVIYTDYSGLVPANGIKLHEVRIVSETDNALSVDVTYTYSHHYPASEMVISVVPNHGYYSITKVDAARGRNTGRFRVGLGKENMKRANKTRSYTSMLTVRFEHFNADRTYDKELWSKELPYRKNWKL